MDNLQRSTSTEIAGHVEIANRWRPYLTAVGIDTKGWTHWEIYSLSAFVWDNDPVYEMCVAKLRDDLAHGLVEPGRESVLPDPLPIIQGLSAANKSILRDAVLAARATRGAAGKYGPNNR